MGVEADAFLAVETLVRNWSNRNQTLLPLEVKKKGIGVTEALQASFRDNVRTSGTTVIAEQIFDETGRYVDMGVGRGYGLESKSEKGKRKPKKWMRLMFARLNALEGAIGIRVMESGIDAVKGLK
jgi:hypothetical protein